MNKTKIYLVFLILFLIFSSFSFESYANNFNNLYKINFESDIVEDLNLLGIKNLDKYSKESSSFANTKIIAMFPFVSSDTVFIYIYQSNLIEDLLKLTLDDVEYDFEFISRKNTVVKGLIKYEIVKDRIELSKYTFEETDFYTKEEIYINIDSENYAFTSRKVNNIVVEGEIQTHRILDVKTNGQKILDFFGKGLFYFDPSQVSDKTVDLFYYSFNLYDRDRDAYFEPNEIISVKVEFEELNYKFEEDNVYGPPFRGGIKNTGISEDDIEDLYIITENFKSEVINSGVATIENCKLVLFKKSGCVKYEYPLIANIENLDEESLIFDTLKDNGFKYAVLLGNPLGYRFSELALPNPALIRVVSFGLINYVDFDYEYTMIKNVRLFQITYVENGEQITIEVDNIYRIREDIVSIEDDSLNLFQRIVQYFSNIISGLLTQLRVIGTTIKIFIASLLFIIVVVLFFKLKRMLRFW